MKRKTLAIPIRLVNFSDSSQVLTLFTRQSGLVEAIAKGAHRERNAFQGPFDLAVLWEVVFVERAADRGLSILTDGTVMDGFPGLRRSWAGWTGAAFLIEYLRAVGTAGEPAVELFDLAVEALRALGGSAAHCQAVLCAFEARALLHLGLEASARACADCGRPWSRSDRPVFFSAEAGGILCARCSEAGPRRSGRLVPGRAVRALESLSRGSLGELEPDLPPELIEIIGELRHSVFERELQTLKYGPRFQETEGTTEARRHGDRTETTN